MFELMPYATRRTIMNPFTFFDNDFWGTAGEIKTDITDTGDAFKLVDGLITGYDYKVVSVDGANYLVYTVSRETAGEMDNMMLVLSKIKATTTNLNEKYALVNPLDETSATPYIELDNDKAGDLG